MRTLCVKTWGTSGDFGADESCRSYWCPAQTSYQLLYHRPAFITFSGEFPLADVLVHLTQDFWEDTAPAGRWPRLPDVGVQQPGPPASMWDSSEVQFTLQSPPPP